jgi:hypothetical protein
MIFKRKPKPAPLMVESHPELQYKWCELERSHDVPLTFVCHFHVNRTIDNVEDTLPLYINDYLGNRVTRIEEITGCQTLRKGDTMLIDLRITEYEQPS